MDSSHSEFIPLDTVIDGAADLLKSEQMIVVKEDVSVPNTKETNPCDDSVSIPIIADPECKDLDLCSSSSSNDSLADRWIACPLSTKLFYLTIVSFYILLLFDIWSLECEKLAKRGGTNFLLWVTTSTLNGNMQWILENKRNVIEAILRCLCVHALIAKHVQSLPLAFYPVFCACLLCSVLCRFSTNGTSSDVIHGLSSSTERDSEHSVSEARRPFTSIICAVFKGFKPPSWPSHFESALILFYLLLTEFAWALTVYWNITWVVSFVITIGIWYYAVQTLPCVYKVEVDWSYESKSIMLSFVWNFACQSLIASITMPLRGKPVFGSIYISLAYLCVAHNIRAFMKLHKD